MAKHVATTTELRERINNLRATLRQHKSDPFYSESRLGKHHVDGLAFRLADTRSVYYARKDRDTQFVRLDVKSGI